MTIIGKLAPARTCALSRSLAKWAISSATSPLRTECLDILSPPPGTSEVINQVERDNSRETKIAARLTCTATSPASQLTETPRKRTASADRGDEHDDRDDGGDGCDWPRPGRSDVAATQAR